MHSRLIRVERIAPIYVIMVQMHASRLWMPGSISSKPCRMKPHDRSPPVLEWDGGETMAFDFGMVQKDIRKLSRFLQQCSETCDAKTSPFSADGYSPI